MSNRTLTRRQLVQSALALTAAGVVVGPLGTARALAQPASSAPTASRKPTPATGFGPLVPVGSHLMLPAGFRYVRFDMAAHHDPERGIQVRPGDTMSDGAPVPGAHDGTGHFRRGRTVSLVRNHEMNPLVGDVYQGIDGTAGRRGYDPTGNGGVTISRFDLDRERATSSFVALRGTIENCSGGMTPWGSWLSAEETTAGVGAGLEKPHGYVFEVPAWSDREVEATPITAMGRFVHEAAGVDPRTGIVYMTEDNGDPFDGLYRYVPSRPGRLAAGGRLQMLAIVDQPNFSAADAEVGTRYACWWVDVDEPDPSDAEDDPAAVFSQGDAKGAMRFLGNEGGYFADGSFVFTESDGGPDELGQVWRYTPCDTEGRDDDGPSRRRRRGGTLELVFRSPDDVTALNPDAVVTSPHGSVLFAEDGDGEDVDGVRPEYVKVVTGTDAIQPFCTSQVQLDIHLHNLTEDPEDQLPVGARGYSEFSGMGFVDDWMFCNLQYPGETFAITGPWPRSI